MEYKKIIEDNYTLHLINSDRFKIMNVVVFLTKKYNEKDVPYGVLLTKNLVYSTKNYNTKNKIAIKGEELYGSRITSSFTSTGDSLSFSFALDFLNPKYTKKEYLSKSIEFLCEVLFNPNVTKDGFDEQYFNIIKNDVIAAINSTKDNPAKYASIEYGKIMYKGTPSAKGVNPTVEEIEKVTPLKLYEYYNKLFNGEYKIDIAVHGEYDDEIINIIKERFSKVKSSSKKINLYVKPKNNKFITKTDTLPFKQSRLLIGYKIKDPTYHELNHVLKVYNTMLGTMNDSLLFNVVREKNSLCYSIGSYFSKYNSALTIYAGINKDNADKSIELIKKCVEMMGDKKVISSLYNYALKTINTYLNNYYDDVTSQINKYYIGEFEITEDIETLREKLNSVTVDEIVELNKKINIQTIYLLKGDN